MALYRYDVVYIKKCHGVEQSLTFHLNFAYQLLLMRSIHKKVYYMELLTSSQALTSMGIV